MVIATAMTVLGYAMSEVVRQNIREGVASTAAASLDSLIANALSGSPDPISLGPADRGRLDRLFDIGSEADATALMQIRIFALNERPIYEASGDILDGLHNDRFVLAKADQVSSDVVELPLASKAPVGTHPITLLRIYAPLHSQDTGETFAVAALYYSAKSLVDISSRTQQIVWIVVLIIGLVVICVLYAFVAGAERTITRQSIRLSDNLRESRALSEEVRTLHQRSEQLRVDATEANEQLLARVGSDIHDGPLQLLTLTVLQLTQKRRTGEVLDPTISLATEAIRDLRNISSGLVLPELAGLTLKETLSLAVQRHEASTGTAVDCEFLDIDSLVEADVQVCLYRVTQEALSNAFRHAAGHNQSVNAYATSEGIVVEVSNEAMPVEPSVEFSGPRTKLGLRGMRLRLEAVGGSMSMEMRENLVILRANVPRRLIRA